MGDTANAKRLGGLSFTGHPFRTMTWRHDVGPSFVVLLISIPLSMGIAIASGVAPIQGLISAVVGGIIIGKLTGCPLQISGPAAGLAVMVLEVIQQHGIAALGTVVLLVGLIQICAGFLRLGQVFRAVSPAVINGMQAGIGALIFCAQFHVMVDDAPKGSGWKDLIGIPMAVYKGVVPVNGEFTPHTWAALVGLLTLAILVLLRTYKSGPLAQVPAPLVAVLAGTLGAWAADLPIQRVNMPENLLSAFVYPDQTFFQLIQRPSIWISAAALAFVASAATLLCSTAVDSMHDGVRTNYDQELFAQGVGNVVCGGLGSLPTTGVITRTTANVESGARSSGSGYLAGAWLLIILVAFPKALEIVPKASLAALLVYVGFELVRGRPYAELRRYGKSELVIFTMTISIIIVTNLLTGILVGLFAAALKLVFSQREKFHRLGIETKVDGTTHQIHVHLTGAASFLRIPRLAACLENLPETSEVHLHVEELAYIDHACLDLLDRWECDRLKRRAPVRVQWQTLHHRYHVANPLDETPEQHKTPPPPDLRLLDFLSPERILIAPSFKDKWDAIEKLTEHLVRLDSSLPKDDLYESIVRREREVSTAIGHGLMIPHGTLPSEHEMTGVLAISSQGWQFSGEEELVHCVLLLATPPEQASRHLAVLAAFARLFMNNPELKARLISSTDPAAADLILSGEEALSVNYAFEERNH